MKTKSFWTLIGVGILVLLLAAAWRVATGAELEATGKEWSLKVTEAANKLDEAREQLEAEAERLKGESAKRDAFWAAQVKAARESCPKAIGPVKAPPPPENVVPKKALNEVAKTADDARAAAKDIRGIRVPGLKLPF